MLNASIMSLSEHHPNLPLYLLEHLRRIALELKFVDFHIQENGDTSHGEGFMAALHRVTLVGNRKIHNTVKRDVVRLVCKLLPKSLVRRVQFKSTILFEREVYMYGKVFPYLMDFQKTKGLTEKNGFFQLAKCYAAIADHEKEQYTIIMEDLHYQEFKLWDKVKSIDFDHVKQLMIALARLNGATFLLRDQQPAMFKRFQDDLYDVYLRMLDSSTYRGLFESSFDFALETLHAERDIDILKWLKRSWIDLEHAATIRNIAEPFSVLSQGDCWNNNIMFNWKQDVRILDWQLGLLSSPATDITRFMMTSTDKSFRDRYFDQLIHIYYDTVRETIFAGGSDPSKLFTFADLQHQLKQFGKYSLVWAPLILEIMVSDPSNIVDMDDFANYVDKYGSSSKSLCRFTDETRRDYRQRLNDVITDAINYGWINEIDYRGIRGPL